MWRPEMYCESITSPHGTVVNRAEIAVTVGKINCCTFTSIVRAMSSTMSIPYTAGIRLCSWTSWSLFFTRTQTSTLMSDWPHIVPGRRKLTCFWFLFAWVLMWLGICFGLSAIQTHAFGFCLFPSEAISPSTFLVATSHRRQLQTILFHNYCDHPCRMAQLWEQLGRINQSCGSRAGGVVQREDLHCVVCCRVGFRRIEGGLHR